MFKKNLINLLLLLVIGQAGFSQKNSKNLTDEEVRNFVTTQFKNQVGYKNAVKGFYDALSNGNTLIWNGVSRKNKPGILKFEVNSDGSYKSDGSEVYEDSINVTIHDVYLMGTHANVMGTIQWYVSGVNTVYRTFSCIVMREKGTLKYIRWASSDNSDYASKVISHSTKLVGGVSAFNEMRDAMLNGEFKRAKIISDSLVEKDPNWALAHLGQLQYYSGINEKNKAEEYFNKAFSKLKGVSSAERHLILAYSPYEDIETTKYHLDQALFFASDDLLIRFLKSMNETNAKIAIEIMLAAWQRFPTNGAVNNLLGYKYMQDGQMEKAKQHFEIYIRQYPKTANAYDSYGDYYSKMGDKKKAKEMYLKAYELNNEFTGSKKKAEKL